MSTDRSNNPESIRHESAPNGSGERNAHPPIRLKGRRGSKLDEPILQFIGHFQAVTTYQVLDRFFTSRDKSPVYGYRLLKRLREAGFITSAPIYPELGAASLTYLALTKLGWAAIGVTPSVKALRPLPRPYLEYSLQFAEMMIVRAGEGWREVRPDSVFKVIRNWGLAQFRDRRLNDHEIIRRATIERMPEVEVPFPLLIHQSGDRIRLVLPVREGENFQRTLRNLPDLALFPPMQFELVCANAELAREATDTLSRYAERKGFKFEIYHVAHFNARPNPRKRK